MDFKSFRNTTRTKETKEKPPTENDIRKTAEAYSGKSDSELLGDIFRMASEQKANGSLNDEKLRAFANSVAPMLNEDQKARLNGVLDMLKNK